MNDLPGQEQKLKRWTVEQQRAITAGGRDILVAAGAGSGKTRVLVERILRRITGKHGEQENTSLEISRFLVVTFTNAAAAEMKHRLADGLKEILARRPAEPHIRRQLLLLNSAQISTIHSFCMDVIRRYSYLRRLDTLFRIVDENEARLLRYEALEKILEARYEECEPGSSFYRLVDLFSTDRGDQPLQDLVLRIYDFSRSYPAPQRWLREQAAVFARLEPGSDCASPWENVLLQQAGETLSGMAGRLEQALELAAGPEGPRPYLGNLQDDLSAVRGAREASGISWDALQQALQSPAFQRLKPCRKDSFDPAVKEQVSVLRNSCKDEYEQLRKHYFQRSLREQRAELRHLSPLIDALVALVEDFEAVYQEIKKEKSLADYSDLEHRALLLLTAPAADPDDPRPSEAALDYRKRFAEILVDEYQDINPVQEAILQLVAAPAPRGNRFMVGDVKQSIYRFRLAEPALFQEKYCSFQEADTEKTPAGAAGGETASRKAVSGQAAGGESAPADTAVPAAGNAPTGGAAHTGPGAPAPGSAPGERIVLSKNFRSRGEILDGVNDLFSRFMDESVGEVSYDTRAALQQGTDFPTPRVPLTFYLLDREGTVSFAPGSSAHTEAGTAAEDHFFAAPGVSREDSAVGAGPGQEEDYAHTSAADRELEELGQAELEGRLLALKIREIMGLDGGAAQQVYDRAAGRVRPLCYRDVVILLRSARNWAPALLDALRQADIPAYMDLGTGYFSATEVEVVLSLLKVIDNPLQDIPLAAVLRSPLVGLEAREMAAVRSAAPKAAFFDAVQAFSRGGQGREPLSAADRDRSGEGLEEGAANRLQDITREKLQGFLERLYCWQDMARQDSLAALIWDIFRETGYYDIVGGLPGGRQRQANLRALYDRARQYEAARFRGLFRFLRFIDGVRERGGDLGEARALGEQEDVVRIMTVHKSKGLEFPVVFVAGLGKAFNLQDLSGHFLLHKVSGFGPRYLDMEKRISYPTLAWQAVRQLLLRETLSEEMRILYVAMTRAEERLYLVGSVREARRVLPEWARTARSAGRMLPVPDRARAKSALDWLAPVLLRHPAAAGLRRAFCSAEDGLCQEDFRSSWDIFCLTPADLQEGALPRETAVPGEDNEHIIREQDKGYNELQDGTQDREQDGKQEELQDGAQDGKQEEVQDEAPGGVQQAGDPASVLHEDLKARIARLEPLPGEKSFAAEVARRLGWTYPYRQAAGHFAKLSVSELSKVLSAGLSAEDAGESARPSAAYARVLWKRPAYLGQKELSPGERGSAYHVVMQHLSWQSVSTLAEVEEQLEDMRQAGRLTVPEREAVQAESIFAFFQSPLGRRVLSGREVYREVPFSLAVPLRDLQAGAGEVGAGEAGAGEEKTCSGAAGSGPFVQPPAFGEEPPREGAEAQLSRPARAGGTPAGHVEEEIVLVQGVLDCLVLEKDAFLLIDYKTGSSAAPGFEAFLDHYRRQLGYYARAVEQIWREPVAGCFLYFFDDGRALEVVRPK